MSDLKIRTITGILGAAVLVGVLVAGGIVLKAALLLLSAMMCYEFTRAFSQAGIHMKFPLLLLVILGMFVAVMTETDLKFPLLFGAVIALFSYVFHDETRLEELCGYFMCIIYIPYFVFQLAYLDHTPFLALVFVISFGTDTCAYLVGSTFGKHKSFPSISPNKSWEGTIGGIVGCVILSVIYLFFNHQDINVLAILFIVVASISSQLGDLLASKIKRRVGIKDYGKILPGHGGMMDRFDSIIPVIPLVYSLYVWLYVG